MHRALPLLLLACLLAPARPRAQAGGPRPVEVGGAEALAKGTLETLALGADGVLRPGPAFEALPLGAPTAWSAAWAGGSLWVGCGNDASLRRIGPDGRVVAVALPEGPAGGGLMVTALAGLPSGDVVAAVFPGGRLLKVGAADGAVALHATLPVEHVWALRADARGGLVAASGLPGALWAVDPFGAVSRLADVDDDHARCLAGAPDDLLVGTAGKGRVLRWHGGRLSVLRDLEQDEVVGVVRLADGSLLVAANADAGGGNAQQLATLLKQIASPPATRGEQKAPERAALQDGTLLHLQASGAVETLWQAKKTALLTLVADGEGASAGVHPSGRVLHAVPGRGAALTADLPEAEASVLLAGPDGLAAVVTSNPAVLHRRRPGPPAGAYLSAPLDAGAVARWGRLTALGSGLTAASFRSGETAEPDASWTAWAPVGGFDGASGDTGTTARFLQVRLALTGPAAALRGLSVVAEAPNRAPRLADLTVTRPKPHAQGPGAEREIAWKAEDPESDGLLFTVELRREGASRWTALVSAQALEKTGLAWDTTGLPDGVYRVRVTASDAPDNPVERARQAVLESAPVRIDNTAPRVRATARRVGDRLLLEGEAEDQPGGQVVAVRVALDGGPWQVLAAKDGLFDAATEGFAASLPDPGPGEHDLVVQALDADRNAGALALGVGAPPG